MNRCRSTVKEYNTSMYEILKSIPCDSGFSLGLGPQKFKNSIFSRRNEKTGGLEYNLLQLEHNYLSGNCVPHAGLQPPRTRGGLETGTSSLSLSLSPGWGHVIGHAYSKVYFCISASRVCGYFADHHHSEATAGRILAISFWRKKNKEVDRCQTIH